MDRKTHRNGLLNLLILAGLAGVGYGVARYSGSLAGQVASAFLLLGALASALSSFQIRLRERERLERLEFDEVSKTGSGSTLFQDPDQSTDTLPARRSREQFERFFVPGFTIFLFLLQAIGAWQIWGWLAVKYAVPFNQPLVALGVFGLSGLALFLIGTYSAGLVRLENQKLLGPGASYVLLGAYLYFLAAAAVVAVWAVGIASVDLILARVLVVLLGLLALETLITLLLELYRPRIKGGEIRLLYESRLVGLLSHPEGLITTAAQALDYQFGFKVSETWFYRFMERALAWLVLAQVGLLLVSTSFVFIDAGDEALLERFGQPIQGREVLGPGFHFKLPWPVDQVHRFRTREVQTVQVGLDQSKGGGHHDHGPILWAVSHAHDEFLLLVASRDSQVSTNETGGRRRPPVNLLAASIPVQYQVTDLKSWAYNYSDAGSLLKRVATREVVRYLVSVDLLEIMSTKRASAAEDLRVNIQARADELGLGVRILFVGLADVHPPVAVAASYESVVGARQKREAEILSARADGIRTNAWAAAEAVEKLGRARASGRRSGVTAQAKSALFLSQLPVYEAAPEVYAERLYLATLAEGSVGSRKIVIASTNTQNVIEFDFQRKIGADMLDLQLNTPGK